MHFKDYSFEKLPFSELFKTYVNNFDQLSDFYCTDPFNTEAVKNKADKFDPANDVESAARLLTDFNRQFSTDQAAFDNINRLHDKRTLSLVTGQQLGIYGGPLYTVLKIISTLHLAQKLEKELERPVIPVFWLADEDHDYDEVKNVTLLDRDKMVSFSYENDLEDDRTPPVADISFNGTLESFRNKIRDGLIYTDFTEELWELLDDCYKPGATFRDAFGNLIAKLFSKHGLVLAGSNTAEIKKLSRICMKFSVEKVDEIRDALESQSEKLGKEFHQQVTLYDSNLFYLDSDLGRTKIIRNGKHWETDTGKKWTTDELTEEIERYPERFSPNVFLRPIFQDLLFPTIGYVAGPGEIAYYGQMKELYSLLNLEMPIIIPRLSASLIEPAIDRILDELPFEIGEYNERIEDLESRFVEQAEKIDVEGIFSDWKQKVNDIATNKKEEIKKIDPTLEGAAGKAVAVFESELDTLKGKIYRSIKQKEETQLNRIRKIKSNLFPGNEIQERSLSFIYFMNKYGVDLWDEILDKLDENNFNNHKLIYL